MTVTEPMMPASMLDGLLACRFFGCPSSQGEGGDFCLYPKSRPPKEQSMLARTWRGGFADAIVRWMHAENVLNLSGVLFSFFFSFSSSFSLSFFLLLLQDFCGWVILILLVAYVRSLILRFGGR